MFRSLIAFCAAVFACSAFAAVDVNSANRADLETVKGIGPSMSARILQAREAGPFKNWGDLVERVSGIGAGNAAKMSQGGLTVGGNTFEGGTAAPAKAERKAKSSEGSKTAGMPKADDDGTGAKPKKSKSARGEPAAA